ncbi:MAG: S9 family peptidase [Steroidobacteraceae bacterium]
MTAPRFARFVASLLCFTVGNAAAADLTIERLFAAPDLSGPTLRGAAFTPDDRRITYLRARDDAKDIYDLWAYDIAARKHARLVDSAALATAGGALSREEQARRERQRTSALGGILAYDVAADGRRILVPLGGDLYLYDLDAPPARAVRRLTATAAYETDARFSPRGRYVSFIRDANLYTLDIASGREIAITRDGGGPVSFGVAEFIAQEEMNRHTGYWWSPDEKRIAFTRVDEAPVAEIERFEIYADRVEVVKQRYPATGARNADVRLYVSPVGGAAVRVDLGANPDIYLARVQWLPDGRALAVQRQSRDQQTLTLLRADATTGVTRTLLTERSATWVDICDELTFVSDRGDFLWGSSRTGYHHLYLYDADGNLRHPVTSGEWMVAGEDRGDALRAIRGVDRRRGLVWFMSNAASPIERQLYVTSYRKAGAPRRVSRETGWHTVRMSADARYYLDTLSDSEHPPSVTLRRADGRPEATLIANTLDASHPYAPYLASHQRSRFGTLTARDGQTLYYQLTPAKDMQPGRRYPVIVDVYGGPSVLGRVRNAWGNLFRQYLAQSGYVVFTLDNRGTAYRGVKFDTAAFHRLGSVEVEDQVTGVEYLRTLPGVDPARIGIWGWSYGGFMTLMSMMQAPDYFAAGVAGAPVTDFRLYDTHYTERYMGTPAENPQGYAFSDVRTHAEGLKGPLLIMHGMADDNVLFTNSTALFARLQDLDKPFAVMPYPGGKHGLMRHTDMGPHASMTVKRFFDENLR